MLENLINQATYDLPLVLPKWKYIWPDQNLGIIWILFQLYEESKLSCSLCDKEFGLRWAPLQGRLRNLDSESCKDHLKPGFFKIEFWISKH